jgi:hypothetical protein
MQLLPIFGVEVLRKIPTPRGLGMRQVSSNLLSELVSNSEWSPLLNLDQNATLLWSHAMDSDDECHVHCPSAMTCKSPWKLNDKLQTWGEDKLGWRFQVSESLEVHVEA